MRHGWDGEPAGTSSSTPAGEVVGIARRPHQRLRQPRPGLARAAHPPRAATPRLRYRGAASSVVDARRRWAGPSSVGRLGRRAHRGFAAALGCEPKSVAVNRRQHLRELEPGLADRLYDEAVPHAGDYELVRIEGRRPAELLRGARGGHGGHQRRAARRPRDRGRGVHRRPRARRTRTAQLASGYRFYRVIARHRGTGEIAGLTVVTVDSEKPVRRATSTTPPSSARTVVTGSACCSRPT